jgi:hypothetical protein
MMRALVGWWLGAVDEAASAALAMAIAGLALSLSGPRMDAAHPRPCTRGERRDAGLHDE